jgi:hypothetical protein
MKKSILAEFVRFGTIGNLILSRELTTTLEGIFEMRLPGARLLLLKHSVGETLTERFFQCLRQPRVIGDTSLYQSDEDFGGSAIVHGRTTECVASVAVIGKHLLDQGKFPCR